VSHPPRRRRNRKYGLHVWQHGNCQAPPLQRDEHVRRVRRVGRRRWKREVGYHRRSLAETAVSRLVRLFGAGVAAQTLAAQTTIARLRAAALNRMTQLGMPASHAVAPSRAPAQPHLAPGELRNRAAKTPKTMHTSALPRTTDIVEERTADAVFSQFSPF
jgi:hypothetical protein